MSTLYPKKLDIRNQHDQNMQHWIFIFQKYKKICKFYFLNARNRTRHVMVISTTHYHWATSYDYKTRDLFWSQYYKKKLIKQLYQNPLKNKKL
jgi:hypothetical protein